MKLKGGGAIYSINPGVVRDALDADSANHFLANQLRYGTQHALSRLTQHQTDALIRALKKRDRG